MGMFMESVKIALHALVANKMRSFLTMLGIIIGVGAVIAMVALGMGVRQRVTDSIASMGSNMLIIRPGAAMAGGIHGAAGSRTTLKYEDALALRRQLRDVEHVSPLVFGAYQVVSGRQNWKTTVQGVTPEHMLIRDIEVVSGSFLTEKDLTARRRVAIIGPTVAENLFGEENPVGKSLRINDQPFQIIGLMESKGQSAVGQDQDDMILIPITTAMERLLAITHLHMIHVQVTSQEKMGEVQGQIETVLRHLHRLHGEEENDFQVQNLISLMNTMNETTSLLTLFLGSIAAISLIVGGIGIMNIMMVSVTERTREIGIRKALGATFRNIMTQFLIESVVISVIGGLLGIALGMTAAISISSVGGFPTLITAAPVLVAFFFSVAIGLFFGIYPARKAAKLDPIEALRYE